MAKSRRPHIQQSYFKRLRNCFSRQARRFLCISRVEDRDDSKTCVAEIDGSKPPGKPTIDLRRMIVRTSQTYTFGADGCECGGIGEHPVAPAASAHTDLERYNDFPKPSTSSPVLLGTPDEVLGLPDCRVSLLGYFHQGNIPKKWNPSKYDGTQCTTISFTAIVASAFLPTPLWSSRTINRIVRLGDRLHNHLIEKMKGTIPKSCYLAADEMPKSPEEDKYIWPVKCTQCQEFQGLLYPDPTDRFSVKNQLSWDMYPGHPLREFGDALERCLGEDVQGCIVTMSNRSSAIFKSPVGEYLIFDSHAKDILGVPDCDGKASLLRFSSVSQLAVYFRDMTVRETRFALTGFKVEPTY